MRLIARAIHRTRPAIGSTALDNIRCAGSVVAGLFKSGYCMKEAAARLEAAVAMPRDGGSSIVSRETGARD